MSKTTYVWDEVSDNVIEEYEDGILSVSYTHEPGPYGNLLSQNRNGVTSYYHYDGRGDTVALTDDAGNVTDTKEYDAWGSVLASTGSTVTPYQFGGRHGYQTGNTGVYVRARMYQPTVARWGSKDPLLFVNGPNMFTYAGNQAVLLVDPAGTMTGDNGSDLPPQEQRDCKDRTTWKPEYCEGCSVCRCSETKFGKVPYPDNWPWAEIFRGYMDRWGVSFNCELHVKIADCGMNERKIAWTCAKRISGKTHIFICLPSSMKTCEMKYTFAHESYHAFQKCGRPNMKFWPKAECVKSERPAWEKQCQKLREINCCDADPGYEACKPIDECITRGVNELSCNEELRGSFDPCETHVPMVWPEFRDAVFEN